MEKMKIGAASSAPEQVKPKAIEQQARPETTGRPAEKAGKTPPAPRGRSPLFLT